MHSDIPHITKSQVKLVRQFQQKKVRDEHRVFVAEGDKCIGELLGSYELVMYIEIEQREQHHPQCTLVATAIEIEQMSNMRTPQGSIAVFRQPEVSSERSALDALVLALDGVQDPGNLGTIVRTCDWFGIRDIYCSQETADCYNPKVVQASMGALARVRIHYVDLAEWLTELYSQAIPIYGTLLDGKDMYRSGAIEQAERGVIIMGNEGNGISEIVRKHITHPLYIPSYGDGVVESLNVSIATAITLAEFRRISQHQ